MMLKIYLANATVHSIPLENRTAAGLGEQLAALFGAGGDVLSMRIEETAEPEVEDTDPPTPKRSKRSQTGSK